MCVRGSFCLFQCDIHTYLFVTRPRAFGYAEVGLFFGVADDDRRDISGMDDLLRLVASGKQ